jgi:hypothetical protein
MEFALLIDGVFQEIRRYDSRPPDLPQKLATWHDVLREYGEPFEGLVDDVWVIRTVDPAKLPPPVPESITRRQAALELHALKFIALQEALDMVRTATVPKAIAAIFDKLVADGSWTAEQRTLAEIDFAADNYYRANSLLMLMGLTSEQIDQFFISASDR